MYFFLAISCHNKKYNDTYHPKIAQIYNFQLNLQAEKGKK